MGNLQSDLGLSLMGGGEKEKGLLKSVLYEPLLLNVVDFCGGGFVAGCSNQYISLDIANLTGYLILFVIVITCIVSLL